MWRSAHTAKPFFKAAILRAKVMFRFIAITCAAGIFMAGASLAEGYVSVKRITKNVAGTDVPVRVYYPTDVQAIETRFGPWTLDIAKNAPPSAGSYPLIMISHGLGGNDWNHHLLARSLVMSGFVVGAVRHPDDFMRVGTPEHLALRPLELRMALDAVLEDRVFSSLIDETRIGAFGFSIGGYTVLTAAGGLIDLNRIAQHCKTSQNDPEYCIGEENGDPLPIWLRAKRMFYKTPNVDLEQDLYDPRLKSIVLAAPVGLPFSDLTRATQPVLLIRAGNDQSLRHPYHAHHIKELLTKPPEYKVIEDLHHYAFLSPFPEQIASEVGAPAQDPDGFDRLAFLNEINDEIVAFFAQSLNVE